MSKTEQTDRPASGAGLGDKQTRDSPASTLELYDGIINPQPADDVVADLGTGYYTEDEQWQQVLSYRDGMFGDALLARGIAQRAISETITALGRHGAEWWDPNRNEYREKAGVDPADTAPRESPREAIRKRGKRIWHLLGIQKDEEEPAGPSTLQIEALLEHAGITGDWMPPQWRMMQGRHEASKSRDARTQDNAFGSRSSKQVKHEREGDDSGFGFRRRRRRGGER